MSNSSSTIVTELSLPVSWFCEHRINDDGLLPSLSTLFYALESEVDDEMQATDTT